MLILRFPMTRLCPRLGWNPSSPLAVWRAVPHICLVSRLLHTHPLALFRESAHRLHTHTHILSSTCPFLGLPFPLLSLPDSAAYLPGSLPVPLSRLSLCAPLAAVHWDVLRGSNVGCLLWWGDGVAGGWATDSSQCPNRPWWLDSSLAASASAENAEEILCPRSPVFLFLLEPLART